MKINKYFLGIVLIIIIIMYFMAGVLFLGNTREDNNMKVSTEQQEIAYQTFKSETEGYSLASKYAENLQNNSLDKEAINLQFQEAKKFLQDNIKGISRESDNFAQMFYYCGIIYGLDRIFLHQIVFPLLHTIVQHKHYPMRMLGSILNSL